MSDPWEIVRCRDGCGKQTAEAVAEDIGWEYLPVLRAWRCPACVKELEEANKRKEQDDEVR